MPTISLHDKGRILSLGYIADLSRARARELLEKHKGEVQQLINKYNIDDSDLVTGMQKLHAMLMQENARLRYENFYSMRETVSSEGRSRRRLRRRKSHRRKPHTRKSHRKKSHRQKSRKKK